MSRKMEAIYDLRHVLWRNICNGVFTSGHCVRKCGNWARGSGLCAACAEKDLAEYIGVEKATEYVAAIRTVRRLELEMDQKAEG